MAAKPDPVIIACDMDNWGDIRALAARLRGAAETMKIGLQAFLSLGPQLIPDLKGEGYAVFTDIKLHDIPNTVAGASRALVRHGTDMLTLHASGGRAMLSAAVQACRQEAETLGIRPPLLLAVTVLTSIDNASALEVGWGRPVEEEVLNLATLAMDCGLDGVVASARELPLLRRELGAEAIIVTPGIRMPGGDSGDQARTATPGEALNAGADFIVVGRAVTEEDDPARALKALRLAAGLPPQVIRNLLSF
jgi:orotidine-5'-phosphate decarboxylase